MFTASDIIVVVVYDVCICVFVCSPQDAAGDELRAAAAVCRDGIGAGGRPAERPLSSGRQLQDRGPARSGQVDTPRAAGKHSDWPTHRHRGRRKWFLYIGLSVWDFEGL